MFVDDGQWSLECLHSFLLEDYLPTRDLPEVSSDLRLLFQVSNTGYLDPVVKDNQCAQNVDIIGIAANNATDFTRNIRAAFKCIRQAGLKLTKKKCLFSESDELNSLAKPFHQKEFNHNFLDKLEFSNSKKALQRYPGFVNNCRNSIPRMAEKLNPFYNLLKAEVPINITSELTDTFGSVNRALSDACELALKQPTPGKQLNLMQV